MIRLGAVVAKVWPFVMLLIATTASAEPLKGAESDLTPVGAIRNGNKDGTIPDWRGGLTSPPTGWREGLGYPDPFASEKPLYVITDANVELYREKLTPGLLALLNRYKDFRMPVYPTHRTASFPPAVISRIERARPAVLNEASIVNPDRNPVPFAQPKNGLEAIWNHLMRYVGGGVERRAHSFPVRGNGDWYKIGFSVARVYDENMEQRSPNRLYSARGYYFEPATLKGSSFLLHEPVDQNLERRSAWVYNAALRRVRRAPDLAYDAIADGSEGLMTVDQADGYNGSPDRYQWKLLGRREIYVPYNTYRIADKSIKYKDVIRKGSVNSDLMRYELHRVWVVEAILKPGATHIYGRRTFYLDEDSWSILIEEAYTTRGSLWRVGLHGLVQYYDVPVPWYRFNIFHDLDSGGYLLVGLDNEVDEPIRFNVKGRDQDFSPDGLRRIADR